MRVLEGLFWIVVVMIGIPVATHWYLWIRLARDTALPQPWRTGLLGLVVILAVGMSGAFLLVRALPFSVGRVMLLPFAVWMGLLMYLFLLVVLGDIVRMAVQAIGGAADPERRRFLARISGSAATALAGVTALFAVRSGLASVQVRQVEVALARLPRELDGTSIVQISDTHIGHTIGRRFVEDVVGKINALAPDVVAITGDLIEGSVEQLRDLVAPLGSIRARFGTFFVTGNHEYYVTMDQVTGANEWIAELERLGIRALRNERVSIGDGQTSFDLGGVDDWSARAYGRGHGPDLARALAGRDASRELVLLAHQPKHAREAAEHGVGLQLSGHTHGGQIWPFHYFVSLFTPYLAGLHRRGDMQIYVSRGTGYFGPPMRLGAPPEITRIVLRSKRA